jgi:hypothetical protein
LAQFSQQASSSVGFSVWHRAEAQATDTTIETDTRASRIHDEIIANSFKKIGPGHCRPRQTIENQGFFAGSGPLRLASDEPNDEQSNDASRLTTA